MLNILSIKHISFRIIAVCAILSNGVTGLSCNYQGKIYNICMTSGVSWNYENRAVCVGISTCVAQPKPYGIVIGGGPTTSPPQTTNTPIPTTTTTPPPTTTTTTPHPTTTIKPTPSPYESPCTREVTERNKEIARAGITRVMITGGASKADILQYFSDPYIQHNPVAKSGVDQFASFFENGAPNSYALTRVIGECDKVLLHGKYQFSGNVFDMLRVDPTKLKMVEHWDSTSSVSSNGSDIAGDNIPVKDPMLTAANKEVAIKFVQEVYMNGNKSVASQYVAPSLISKLTGESKVYSKIHHQIGDGNYVFTLSEGTKNNNALGFYDLFRLENGLIVEYWSGTLAVQAGASGAGIF